MMNDELEAIIEALQEKNNRLQEELDKSRRGKKPTVRNQVIECMRAARKAPHHSVAVAILAKYLSPKNKEESKKEHEERVNALIAEMS